MKIKDERGYLVIAQNNDITDYVLCARMLAASLRRTEPSAKICLLTDVVPDDASAFDYVRTFPFGDRAADSQWKLQNDWQCFYASPFRQTIKLEADMIIPQNISHWFDICQIRDVVVATRAYDYRGRIGTSRYYRKIFDDNDLPDAYNAITYWRLGKPAQTFFDTVKQIFENWDSVMSCLKFGSGQPLNTDLAYAIAIKLLGVEQHTLPHPVPGLTHMKSRFNGLEGDDWTQELIWEILPDSVRINTVAQQWPVHYHQKEFANELLKYYG
jgi:hypothetical protein